MKCPLDGADLQMTDRQGIEIDYCPTCRGVWLDRGELDKLVERSGSYSAPAPHAPQHAAYRPEEKGYRSHGSHKREGFLGELFDF